MFEKMHIKYIYILLATLLLVLCTAVYAQDTDFLREIESKLAYDLMLFSALGMSAIGFLAVTIVILTIRRRSFRAYQEKLSQLRLLYDELGEQISDLGTDRYTDRFLELSERKEQIEASKVDMTGEADRLMEEIQSFLSELEAANTI